MANHHRIFLYYILIFFHFYWDLKEFQPIIDLIKNDNNNNIYIITGRSKQAIPLIKKFLVKNGIDNKIKDIISSFPLHKTLYFLIYTC